MTIQAAVGQARAVTNLGLGQNVEIVPGTAAHSDGRLVNLLV